MFAPPAGAGPLQRTALQLVLIQRSATFRRHRVGPARRALRHSDALMHLAESARERNLRLMPTWAWTSVVRFLGEVDPDLRDELGIDRRPEHIAAVLFEAQELLMRRSQVEREPALAPIIRLFS